MVFRTLSESEKMCKFNAIYLLISYDLQGTEIVEQHSRNLLIEMKFELGRVTIAKIRYFSSIQFCSVHGVHSDLFSVPRLVRNSLKSFYTITKQLICQLIACTLADYAGWEHQWNRSTDSLKSLLLLRSYSYMKLPKKDCLTACSMSELNSEIVPEYGSNFRVLKRNDQTCELQTIIRDK